ncbi:MAG: DUF357 domain-containing protein [Methanobacteriaceae archaeon]|nr:DUF357 domain-containing protein [Methanobacteriaceae archaeon]
MDALARIDKDLKLFEKNIKELESIKMGVAEEKIVDMARSYAQDTTYYVEKEDYLTAFGCITYAHGLLDAVRLTKKLI